MHLPTLSLQLLPQTENKNGKYGFGEFKLSVCCSSKDFEAVETEALICHCHVHRTDVVSSEPAKQDNKGKVSLLFPVLCTHCSILLI